MKHFLIFAAVVTFFSYASYSAFCLPTVQFSHSTKECVQVLPAGSCDDLPTKYHREWVK